MPFSGFSGRLMAGAVVMLFLASPMQAQTQRATSGAKDHRWALSATLFSPQIQEVAIGKKLSRQTMLLVGVAFQWDRTKTEAGGGAPAGTETSRTLGIRPELRIYTYRAERLATYWGVMPFWFSSRTDLEAPGNAGNSPISASSLGIDLTLGVEYELLPNFSAAVHLRPVGYSYSKSEQSSGSRTTTRSQFRIDPAPALVLRIYF